MTMTKISDKKSTTTTTIMASLIIGLIMLSPITILPNAKAQQIPQEPQLPAAATELKNYMHQQLAQHPGWVGMMTWDSDSESLSYLGPGDKNPYRVEATPLTMLSPTVPTNVEKASTSDRTGAKSKNAHESFLPSPLTQFKLGISAYDVKCHQGLTLIIKSSGGYPACVKPDTAIKLAKVGWAKNLSSSTSDSLPLRLYLSVNSTSIYPGQTIGINVSVNNTLSKPVVVYEQDNWGFDIMMVKPCFHTPVEITILGGYYTQYNMTGVKQIPIYRPTICPVTQNFVKSYEFQPLSSQARIVECMSDAQSSCSGSVTMEYHASFNGTWVSWDTLGLFDSGTYTIVGGDEWGHITIRHFEVINPTKG